MTLPDRREMNTVNPAVEASREKDTGGRELANGTRVHISTIPQLLIDDAVRRVKRPEVPYVMDEGKGYEIPNESDPRYLAALDEHAEAQAAAAVDAVILWGIELAEGLPPDEEWLPKLHFYAKRGHVDLSGYDLDNEFEKAFVYKRYIALSARDIGELLPEMISGVTEEDVEAAKASFQSN